MRADNRRVKILLLFLGALGAAQADTAMVDRFFDEYYFRFNPTQGTSAGFHQYDAKLEDYSKASVRERGDILRKFESEFEKQPGSDDRDLILGKIRSDLLELDNIRQWEKNPDTYSGGVTGSIFVIMSRNFAPPAERLKAVIARERQMPAVFDAARANLKNPPRIYTEVAIEQLPGIVGFFEKDVASAFAQVH
jgi:hypothetical protein